MEPTLLTETQGPVRILTLHRPDRLNALNSPLLTELNDAFDTLGRSPDIRAVLLTGAGRGFCAGADLAQSLSADSGVEVDLGALLDRLYNPLVRKMRALRQPVIVAVNGIATGAGMNLALAGDIVLAARSATFAQGFVRIGLAPDAGGSYFLPRLIGDARARALAMIGEPITADRAAAFGMIWQIHDDAELPAAALHLARDLASRPASALAAIKTLFNAAPANSLDAQLDLERDTQRGLGQTADFAEGVAAFLQKRPPVFNRA